MVNPKRKRVAGDNTSNSHKNLAKVSSNQSMGNRRESNQHSASGSNQGFRRWKIQNFINKNYSFQLK